jgi:hypothetical protein
VITSLFLSAKYNSIIKNKNKVAASGKQQRTMRVRDRTVILRSTVPTIRKIGGGGEKQPSCLLQGSCTSEQNSRLRCNILESLWHARTYKTVGTYHHNQFFFKRSAVDCRLSAFWFFQEKCCIP